MRRQEIPGAWYSFATIQGGWGALIRDSHIESSEGRIELPLTGGVKDNVLYLVGATYQGRLVMAGQSNGGAGCWLYWRGLWFAVGGAFGVSMCAFSQDGRFLYVADSSTTGYYRDMETLDHTPFQTNFFTDGIRAVVPVTNRMILGNTTVADQARRINEYIDFEHGAALTVGQGASGLLTISDHGRRIVEPGGTFFIRAQYDGDNIALATVKQTENKAVLHWLTYAELAQCPLEGAGTTDPIVPIGKRCYLGWFEFAAPPVPAPGNCWLNVFFAGGTGVLSLHDGRGIAQWVQGHTVESIEQQAAASALPPIAYWDARRWPRYPALPRGGRLALQAYRLASETPAAFEADMRIVIAQARDAGYRDIALVSACYTSNLSLTSDIAGNVPVYARLARDFPQVTMLLPFSDHGRATGLNDHPEVRPLWQQLADGITGVPDMAQLPDDVFATLKRLRPNYPTPLGDRGATLLNAVAWEHRAQGWGLESKPGGNNCPQPTTGTRCGCDILRTQNEGYDVLGDAENAGVPLQGIAGPADPARFVAAVQPEVVDPEPQPGPVGVLILDYDRTVRRSDPNGLLIRFEAASARPITVVDLELVGDGEPSIRISFLNEPGRDGRYVRGLSFKPVVNGTWTLRVTATDDAGNTGFADGPQQVTVTP